jgi:hypothetical protein
MRKFLAIFCFVCAMGAGVGSVGSWSEWQGEPWEKFLGSALFIGPLLWLGFRLNKEPKKTMPKEGPPAEKAKE